MVLPQQTSEPFTKLNGVFDGPVGFGIERKRDDVADPLVGPLSAVVLDVVRDGVTQHRLAEEDHPIGALLFDRADEAFSEDAGREEKGSGTFPSPRIDGGAVHGFAKRLATTTDFVSTAFFQAIRLGHKSLIRNVLQNALNADGSSPICQDAADRGHEKFNWCPAGSNRIATARQVIRLPGGGVWWLRDGCCAHLSGDSAGNGQDSWRNDRRLSCFLMSPFASSVIFSTSHRTTKTRGQSVGADTDRGVLMRANSGASRLTLDPFVAVVTAFGCSIRGGAWALPRRESSRL